MNKKHLWNFLQHGQLRIGTLNEYRDIEKHGGEIGDEKEGTKLIYQAFENQEWTSQDEVPKFLRENLIIKNGGKISLHGKNENIKMGLSLETENYYLFSCTTEFSKDSMQRFGYNSCLLIQNPKNFFKLVSKTIRHKASFVGFFPCIYKNRIEKYNQTSSYHLALIKPPSYSYQKEIRGLWYPKNENIKPIIIKNRKAITYCSICNFT